jgi:hypothetical protein
MLHVATLLANPGYEIPAVELAAGAGLPGATASAAGSTQPVLDEVARREYRQRMVTLQAEIDDHATRNDDGRVARAQAELEWLTGELRAAAGLAGRVRQFAGSEERARIAVGKAIRRALDRISSADPVIGAELRAGVHTGLRCSYRPS